MPNCEEIIRNFLEIISVNCLNSFIEDVVYSKLSVQLKIWIDDVDWNIDLLIEKMNWNEMYRVIIIIAQLSKSSK